MQIFSHAEELVMEIAKTDFEFTDKTQVRHKPTGITVSTYEYDDPANACSDIIISGTDDRERDQKIIETACEILKENAESIAR